MKTNINLAYDIRYIF